MFNAIKQSIRAFLAACSRGLRRTRPGAFVFEIIVNTAMETTQTLVHQQTTLTFAVPNKLNCFRVQSFSTKEPETLEWIDSIPRGAVVWDIGANVGLYSCYAAKARDCQVVAFEPSVFNLELLARNIYLNGLTGKIVIVPLPLSDRMCVSTLNMTTMEWGGALSTFGQDYGWDGQKMRPVFKFQTIGVSSSDAVQLLRVPQPSFIKIDVDGIEHLVLGGAKAVLSNVDGVLIEINDGFHEQAEQCQKLLLGAGLVLKEKRHSALFDSEGSFGGGKVWNQIWIRT